jgi:hypothetical protein
MEPLEYLGVIGASLAGAVFGSIAIAETHRRMWLRKKRVEFERRSPSALAPVRANVTRRARAQEGSTAPTVISKGRYSSKAAPRSRRPKDADPE